LEQGIELKVVQELLGHASIRLTADLYTHVLMGKKKDSIEKLSRLLGSSGIKQQDTAIETIEAPL
jgi:site-specific recombinase XerD